MMTLHPSKEQLAAEPTVQMTLGDAVRGGTIANETLGYFIARVYQFLLRAGCKAEHVRFRQHLPDEMAHYACDCWDAEIEMSLGWVECAGYSPLPLPRPVTLAEPRTLATAPHQMRSPPSPDAWASPTARRTI